MVKNPAHKYFPYEFCIITSLPSVWRNMDPPSALQIPSGLWIKITWKCESFSGRACVRTDNNFTAERYFDIRGSQLGGYPLEGAELPVPKFLVSVK